MEIQTIINIVFAVAFIAYVVWSRNPTFGIIKCEGWEVVDKYEKTRVKAGTNEDGTAGVQWLDKDGKLRIGAATDANGEASVGWLDKDEKMRIVAGIDADGTVSLPTEDLKPPKKPQGGAVAKS